MSNWKQLSHWDPITGETEYIEIGALREAEADANKFSDGLATMTKRFQMLMNDLEAEKARAAKLLEALDWISKGPTWGLNAPSGEKQAQMASDAARKAIAQYKGDT